MQVHLGDQGGQVLPKGAQLHHVVLLEPLWGFTPSAEQLGCSWLYGGGEHKASGVRSAQGAGFGGVGGWQVCCITHLDNADGFSGEVVAGVAEEGQH